jgi:hypothetical protein
LSGALVCGLSIAASLLTRGWPMAVPLLLTVWLLPRVSPPWGWVAARFRWTATASAIAFSLPWLGVALWTSPEASQALHLWWSRQADIDGPSVEHLAYLLRTLPWFLWPAWPVAALVDLALAPASGRTRGGPAPDLPGAAGAADGGWRFVERVRRAALVPAAAMLAASLGLPTLRRGFVSLIDWFAVMTFTVLGFGIWAYWVALVTGFPTVMAFKARQLAPGFDPGWIVDEVVLGALATAGWLVLVRLACLAPAADDLARDGPVRRRTRAGLVPADDLVAAVVQRAQYLPGRRHAGGRARGWRPGCVASRGLGPPSGPRWSTSVR